MPRCLRFLSGLFLSIFALAQVETALADPQAFHFVDITEVYSNADGTRQYVEMISNSAGQNMLAPTWIISLNADGTDTNVVFDFTVTYAPGFNTNQTILLMTQAMQNDLGIVADFTILENSIFFPNGRVIFEDPPPFPQVVDAVAYGAYTGSNTGFGTPTAAMPGDECRSLRHNIRTAPKNNSIQWGVGIGTPRNHIGEEVALVCTPVAPILAPIGDKATNENQLLTFGITATDGNGDVIILTVENLPSGANFVNHGNGTGTFTWTPTCLQSNTYPGVLFIASDGGLADSESVTITVNELSDPAVARDSVATCLEDGQILANLQGYDPDLDPVTYAIINGPFFGQVTGFNPSTGEFTYEPDPNFEIADGIGFTITDNNCVADTGLWEVDIIPVNDAPVANDHSAGTTPNTPVAIGAMPASDIDDASLSFSHIAGPFHGGASNLNTANGSFDYLPSLDYEGGDTVFYEVSDGELADTARVLITIVPGCVCNCHADPVCDGNPDVLDVVQLVTVAFRNGSDTIDGACTHVGRSDTNCDCVVDVLDVVSMVNHAFRNDVTPFCDPCADPCP